MRAVGSVMQKAASQMPEGPEATRAVARPPAVMVATEVVADAQVTEPVRSWVVESEKIRRAACRKREQMSRVGGGGVKTIDVTTGAEAVSEDGLAVEAEHVQVINEAVGGTCGRSPGLARGRPGGRRSIARLRRRQ